MIRSSQGWGITLRSIMNQAVSFMNKMYHCKLKMFDRIHRIIGPKDHTHILVTSAWGRWWWNLFTTLMQCNMVIYSFPILGFLIQWLFQFAPLFQFHVLNQDNGHKQKSQLSSYFTTFPLFLHMLLNDFYTGSTIVYIITHSIQQGLCCWIGPRPQ